MTIKKLFCKVQTMGRQRIFTIGKEVNRYGALLDVIPRIACEIETIEMGWTYSIYSTCALDERNYF